MTYHVTSADRVESILSNGLVVNSPSSIMFCDVMGIADIWGMTPLFFSVDKFNPYVMGTVTSKQPILLTIHDDAFDLSSIKPDLAYLSDYTMMHFGHENRDFYWESDAVNTHTGEPILTKFTDCEGFELEYMCEHIYEFIPLTNTFAYTKNISPKFITVDTESINEWKEISKRMEDRRAVYDKFVNDNPELMKKYGLTFL